MIQTEAAFVLVVGLRGWSCAHSDVFASCRKGSCLLSLLYIQSINPSIPLLPSNLTICWGSLMPRTQKCHLSLLCVSLKASKTSSVHVSSSELAGVKITKYCQQRVQTCKASIKNRDRGVAPSSHFLIHWKMKK